MEEFCASQLKCIKNYANQKGFKDFTIEITGESAKGENYLGKIKTIKIIEKKSKKELNLILKESLQGEIRRQAPIEKYYKREIFMYSKLLKEFEIIQNEYNIENKFENFARCVGYGIEDNFEYLILENLKTLGFDLHDRKVQMDAKHVAAVLKVYAKFHALSFVMNQLKPNVFKELKKNLGSVYKSNDPEHNKSMFENLHQQGIQAVKHNERALRGLNKAFLIIPGIMFELTAVDVTNDELKVVAFHGDCWNNNILFKYEDPKAGPSDVRIIDWQLSSVGSPILDVCYFLYTCSSNEMIRDYKTYLNIYYKSLSDMIKQFGLDSDAIYTKTEFYNDWKKYAPYGLFMAVFLTNVSLAENSKTVDLAEEASSGKNYIDSFTQNMGNQKEISKRITRIVLHMLDNDLL